MCVQIRGSALIKSSAALMEVALQNTGTVMETRTAKMEPMKRIAVSWFCVSVHLFVKSTPLLLSIQPCIHQSCIHISIYPSKHLAIMRPSFIRSSTMHLYMHLCFHLSVHASIIHSSIQASIHSCIMHPFIHVSIHQSCIHVSHPSIHHASIYDASSIHPSSHESIHVSIHVSIMHPSIMQPSVHPSIVFL